MRSLLHAERIGRATETADDRANGEQCGQVAMDFYAEADRSLVTSMVAI